MILVWHFVCKKGLWKLGTGTKACQFHSVTNWANLVAITIQYQKELKTFRPNVGHMKNLGAIFTYS